jgi:hypothetical protein
MDDLHDNFSVGDVVEWSEWANHKSRRFRGKVTKAGKTVTAQADADGHTKTFRRRKYSPAFECSKVDVAREQWHRDLVEWWEARPKTEILELKPTTYFEGATVSMAGSSSWSSVRASLDGMQQVADEAHAIREWLRERPEEPQ